MRAGGRLFNHVRISSGKIVVLYATGTFFALHDKSSRNGRLIHGRGWVGGERERLGERERRHRARCREARRCAAGGGLLGVQPERTKAYACTYMPTQGKYSLQSSV